MNFLEEISSLIVPVGTIVFIVVIQILVRGWTPPDHPPDLFEAIKPTEEQQDTESNHSSPFAVRNNDEEGDITKNTNNNNKNGTVAEEQTTNNINITPNPMIGVVDPSTKESDITSKEQDNNNNNNNNQNGHNKNDENNDDDGDDLFAMNDIDNNNGWRCACEGGFLPPGMLKSFGSAEAMMRLGTGQCYHKQK